MDIVITNGHEAQNISRISSQFKNIFREVQILLGEFNGLYSNTLVFLQVIASTSLISPMYSLICYLKGEVNMPVVVLVLYFILVMDGIVVLHVVFGFAGDFYQDAVEGRTILKGCHLLMRCKQFRWFCRSCPTLKVMFGSTNFIDKVTSLVFLHFCICRLLDLLLIR